MQISPKIYPLIAVAVILGFTIAGSLDPVPAVALILSALGLSAAPSAIGK